MSNLSRLRAAMSEANIPAMLVSDIASVKWVTGFTGSFGYVIVTASDALFMTDSRYAIQVGEQVKEMPNAWFQSPVTLDDFLAEQVSNLGITKLGFEATSVTFANFDRWRGKLGAVELVPAPDFISKLRMVKSAAEVDAIRRACGVADACFAHVQRMIQPGVSEWDISLDIEFFIRRSGYELAFEPIVVSGERSARPHGRASEKKLEAGDFVTMDFGAKVDGYCSDITRTVVVAEATDRHREIYAQVLRAEQSAIQMMRPGVKASEVDALARTILDEIGLAQYFGHGLGHGLGSLVHDSGRMNATSADVLEPGQVWTVEPGVYIPGFGGVRIEDDVVVTSDGVEVLTHSDRSLLVLPV
ncbi:MAG TPA: Xaa-Pro peptidase family protein [Fimbriimonadaceae bacterium]|nr:Xaa-Pro peptidase family protein [Fimbriimonadaceae bacterium]